MSSQEEVVREMGNEDKDVDVGCSRYQMSALVFHNENNLQMVRCAGRRKLSPDVQQDGQDTWLQRVAPIHRSSTSWEMHAVLHLRQTVLVSHDV